MQVDRGFQILIAATLMAAAVLAWQSGPAHVLHTALGALGFGGMIVAALLGPITPGGVFVCFAVAAAGLKVGASSAAVLAFITAWALFSATKVLA